MLSKKRIIFGSVLVFLSTATIFVLFGCSSEKRSDVASSSADTITTNGVRLDVEQYISSAYPDSAKKRAALMGYAKALQTAYTNVNSEAEAVSAEPKIIKALSCTNFIIGQSQGSNDPVYLLGKKTANTPERLAQQMKYEKFLDGKVFTISSPEDTAETVCDFNPNSLPN